MNQTVYDVVQERHNIVAARMREVNDELIYTALFGSQNYNMDTANSDIDVHCMYAQNPMRIITNNPIHYPLIESDLAHNGHADIKTVHDMLIQYRKGNLNFLETLWTPYIAVSPGWEWFIHCLRKEREVFLIDPHHLFVTWGGFVRQMIARTTRCGGTLTKPTILTGWREDLGYNPKAFANALRIKETMIRFKNDGNFDRALWMGDYAADLVKIKQGSLPLAEVKKILIDLEAWLKKFLLMVDNEYKIEIEWRAANNKLAIDSSMQDFCKTLEMEAFSKMWNKFGNPDGYLKFL